MPLYAFHAAANTLAPWCTARRYGPAAVGKPLEERSGDRAVAFSVGFVEHPVITRGWPIAAVRSGYLRAALAGVDTYWMPDHLNSLVPRSIAVPKYVGLARFVPDVDAVCEPWTLLGQVAGWNRIGRLRLGVAVTDGGRRPPAVTAQAAATLHLMSRGKAILGIGVGEREGNEPYGVDWGRPVAPFLEEALATIRVLCGFRRRIGVARFGVLSSSQSALRTAALSRCVPADLGRRTRAKDAAYRWSFR